MDNTFKLGTLSPSIVFSLALVSLFFRILGFLQKALGIPSMQPQHFGSALCQTNAKPWGKTGKIWCFFECYISNHIDGSDRHKVFTCLFGYIFSPIPFLYTTNVYLGSSRTTSPSIWGTPPLICKDISFSPDTLMISVYLGPSKTTSPSIWGGN